MLTLPVSRTKQIKTTMRRGSSSTGILDSPSLESPLQRISLGSLVHWAPQSLWSVLPPSIFPPRAQVEPLPFPFLSPPLGVQQQIPHSQADLSFHSSYPILRIFPGYCPRSQAGQGDCNDIFKQKISPLHLTSPWGPQGRLFMRREICW